MTMQEIKTAQSMHKDRLELLNFVHFCLAYAANSNQRTLATQANRALERLEIKSLLMTPPTDYQTTYSS